jgi:hypothetical protein
MVYEQFLTGGAGMSEIAAAAETARYVAGWAGFAGALAAGSGSIVNFLVNNSDLAQTTVTDTLGRGVSCATGGSCATTAYPQPVPVSVAPSTEPLPDDGGPAPQPNTDECGGKAECVQANFMPRKLRGNLN